MHKYAHSSATCTDTHTHEHYYYNHLFVHTRNPPNRKHTHTRGPTRSKTYRTRVRAPGISLRLHARTLRSQRCRHPPTPPPPGPNATHQVPGVRVHIYWGGLTPLPPPFAPFGFAMREIIMHDARAPVRCGVAAAAAVAVATACNGIPYMHMIVCLVDHLMAQQQQQQQHQT